MRKELVGLAFWLVAPAVQAAEKFKKPTEGLPETEFRVSFKMKAGDLAAAGNFVVKNGTQSNYVDGGETPYELENRAGAGVEFKKHSTIVNCLPAQEPGTRRVHLQCQFELSGPQTPVGTLHVQPLETFQYQTEFAVELGHPLALVDEPTRRIEVTVEEVQP